MLVTSLSAFLLHRRRDEPARFTGRAVTAGGGWGQVALTSPSLSPVFSISLHILGVRWKLFPNWHWWKIAGSRERLILCDFSGSLSSSAWPLFVLI